ncbi:hypothetical protein HanRHA438_Chr14g0662171 [Helianthus annuus]|uniref:Uncharacterized protein n=1 Tax=Helianthus annuus TaxID=4232 RepID=A0A251SHH2_HELAN|nr:hypothetical protein HanXRQr2_Chr14g0651441 [Helianthus annuus]KAJ0464685.1 hypothetical protein HanHA300_Chr14g0530081 [Helianthus annuus]KAJ0469327.1 hypothetical protein HanIR_Chr14g0706701 [Helianthus annuus]KAJ0486282.1 hypothetical protein HanHA89_Chr14g0577951 [Helianthus annuus]KAJ0656834.1 hypothetical protein HanLR1_Chr14g0540371 [Helianthus annuus]
MTTNFVLCGRGELKVPVVVKALGSRKEVVLKDNQHISNNISSSSSKVAIREEARVVVIKDEGSRVVTKADTVATKVDSLKEEEVGHKGVDTVVEVAVIHNSMLQEELRHLSNVVGLDLSILVDLLGRPFPRCTKQHKLRNSLCRHCSQRHLEHQLKCMPSHHPLSRWWMSQRISCSSYQ